MEQLLDAVKIVALYATIAGLALMIICSLVCAIWIMFGATVRKNG